MVKRLGGVNINIFKNNFKLYILFESIIYLYIKRMKQ